MTETETNSPIVSAYQARTAGSAARYRTARGLFPSGITHDARYILPHPIYVERAEAGRKWDVDGNEYVDYQGGHGALLLGHRHPEVMQAVSDQLSRGTHFGASSDLEIAWAELVRELVPSAQRVRFTSSGTEATMMAVRLARAFTGHSKLIRLRGHFHGWNDHMTSGYANHFDGTPSTGILNRIAENVLLCDPNDVEGLRSLVEDNSDIAAAILEPTGSGFGQVPLAPEFVSELRQLTAQHGIILIFDEVVTGFRVSPGGAQRELGVVPDLTTLAKVLAGGLPGGAVVGREDVLDILDHERTAVTGRERMMHPGTFNANPVSAAAGCATLKIIRDTDACDRANAYASLLRDAFNAIIVEEGIPWAAYGTFSAIHIFANTSGVAVDPDNFDPLSLDLATVKSNKGTSLVSKLRLAMRVNGVDLSGWPGGPVSAVHDDRDMDHTVAAFQESIRMLKSEGEIAS